MDQTTPDGCSPFGLLGILRSPWWSFNSWKTSPDISMFKWLRQKKHFKSTLWISLFHVSARSKAAVSIFPIHKLLLWLICWFAWRNRFGYRVYSIVVFCCVLEVTVDSLCCCCGVVYKTCTQTGSVTQINKSTMAVAFGWERLILLLQFAGIVIFWVLRHRSLQHGNG